MCTVACVVASLLVYVWAVAAVAGAIDFADGGDVVGGLGGTTGPEQDSAAAAVAVTEVGPIAAMLHPFPDEGRNTADTSPQTEPAVALVADDPVFGQSGCLNDPLAVGVAAVAVAVAAVAVAVAVAVAAVAAVVAAAAAVAVAAAAAVAVAAAAAVAVVAAAAAAVAVVAVVVLPEDVACLGETVIVPKG